VDYKIKWHDSQNLKAQNPIKTEDPMALRRGRKSVACVDFWLALLTSRRDIAASSRSKLGAGQEINDEQAKNFPQ
jgi:hypothetical protein